MNEMDRQALIKSGIDYDEGVEKFMGERELYEGLLVDFLTENTFDEAERCLKVGDGDGFLRAVHAMKSVTGTLAMNGLYRLCFDTVEALRGGDESYAEELFSEAYLAYLRIAGCIGSVLNCEIEVYVK